MGNNVWNDALKRFEWDNSAQGGEDSQYSGGYITGNDEWNKLLSAQRNPYAIGSGGGIATQGAFGPSAFEYFDPTNSKNINAYHPEDQTNLTNTILHPDWLNGGVASDDYHRHSMTGVDYLPALMMAVAGGGIAAAQGAGGAAGAGVGEGAGGGFGGQGAVEAGAYGGLDSGSIAMDTLGNLGGIEGAIPSIGTEAASLGSLAADGSGGTVGGLDSGALTNAGNLSSISGAVPEAAGSGLLGTIGKALLQNPKLLGAGIGLVGQLIGNKGSGNQSAQGALSAPSPGAWNPQQQQIANSYFGKSAARQVNPYQGDLARAPIIGGEHQWFKPMAEGGHVHGALPGGQDDVVPIMGAPGEYMLDAHTVSALGDGNTEAGVRKLDEFRRSLREHKSGNQGGIPPRSLSIQDYMRGK